MQTLRLCFLSTCFPLVRAAALLVITTILYAPPPLRGQGSIGELSRQFEDQEGPVRKAKFFPKLGDAHLELVRQKVKTGDYQQALTVLEAHIEAIKKLHTALRAAVPDPEKKSDGFRQLEAHLRRSIRTLNDVVFGLPVDQREPFRVGVQELQLINSELIKDLFPRQPGPTKKGNAFSSKIKSFPRLMPLAFQPKLRLGEPV